MEIVNTFVLFAIGFYILIKGAEFLVHGATGIAKYLNISTFFIGAVIVAFGTSIPELSVSVAAAFSGSPIGLGAVFGSNIFNVLIGLGLSALFYPIALHRNWVVNDFSVHVGATVLVSAIILFPVLGSSEFSGIGRLEAFFMLTLIIAWTISIWRRKVQHGEETDIAAITFAAALIALIAGFIGVFIGGRWVVDGAVLIAEIAGIPEAVIGLTIIALGTSLPEFTVSFVALMKGNTGIGVGNIVGTNIMNLLAVLGITALIKPIVVQESFLFTIVIATIMTLLLFISAFIGKRYMLSRFEGTIFIVFYILYIIFLLSMG